MPKQTIEIDVPEEYEVDNVLLCTSLMSSSLNQIYCVQFKKKGPEYMEVREFLHRTHDGRLYVDSITNGHHCTPEEAEKFHGFVRWVDSDWRKVEI